MSSIRSSTSLRPIGSRPVVGSSRKTTGPGLHHARREVEPSPHPARVRAHDAVGRRGEVEALEQLVRAGARLPPGEALQPAEQDQVLAAGQLLVERRLLAGERDHLADVLPGRARRRGRAPPRCRRRAAGGWRRRRRPGEKLDEELTGPGEFRYPTAHPAVTAIPVEPGDRAHILDIQSLVQAAHAGGSPHQLLQGRPGGTRRSPPPGGSTVTSAVFYGVGVLLLPCAHCDL